MGAEQSQPTVEPEEEASSEGPVGSPSALVICGPSGVGKGTLIELLLEDSEGFAFSISHTTRKSRGNEEEGVEYYFIDKATFEKGIENGAFLEYAKVHDNYYGTSRAVVEKVLDAGACCILDIDVQGARQIRESGIRAVFVFIAPPSEEELEKRLRGRGTESEQQIHLRLKTARQEMQSMGEPGLFDFCIVNGDLSQAYAELRMIAMKAKNGQLPESTENGVLSPTKSEKATDMQSSGMRTWHDKIALVTATGSPLGSEICATLSKAGMRLIAVGRSREDLEKLQGNLKQSGHHILAQNFLPVVCDTTKEGEVISLRKIAQKRWPQASSVNVLVNIASCVRDDAGLVGGSTAAWVEMLSSNVLATLMCNREAIKVILNCVISLAGPILQDMKDLDDECYVLNICIPDSQMPAESAPLFKATSSAIQSISADLRNEVRERDYRVNVTAITSEVAAESDEVARVVFSVLASYADVECIRL